MAVTYSAHRQTSRDFKSESSGLLEDQTSASRISQSPIEERLTLDPQEPAVVGQRTTQSRNIRIVNVMQQLKQALCSTKMKKTVYPILGSGIVTGIIVYLALSYAPKTSHLEEPPKIILSLCGSVGAGMVTLLGIKCRPCVAHLINACGQLFTRERSNHEDSHGRAVSEANVDDADPQALLSPKEQGQPNEEVGVSNFEEQELFEQGKKHLMEFIKKTGCNETELYGENAVDYYDVLRFHAGITQNVNIEEMCEGAKALHKKIPDLNLGKDQCRWVASFIQVWKEDEREEKTARSDPIFMG
ncbi:hypothetical protein ElyMa_006572500 [Elysia marginata]|uniref:Uncharacterized protein n=1 Tax=Elysia marginata TaxID=1093978 RepID=A0AAV4ICC1_9GAST|nr:hypothetical protein ElyMa_006572500 [Elysia marginata]